MLLQGTQKRYFQIDIQRHQIMAPLRKISDIIVVQKNGSSRSVTEKQNCIKNVCVLCFQFHVGAHSTTVFPVALRVAGLEQIMQIKLLFTVPSHGCWWSA